MCTSASVVGNYQQLCGVRDVTQGLLSTLNKAHHPHLTPPREVYDKGSPGFKGRCTAPLLVDARSSRLVSNESASIVRQLEGLELPGATGVDLYPEALRGQIDELNDWVGVVDWGVGVGWLIVGVG